MDFQTKKGEIISFNNKTYVLMEKLGQGRYGQVYEAAKYSNEEYYEMKKKRQEIKETNRMIYSFPSDFERGPAVAVKIIDKCNLNNPQKANEEIQMIKSMNHRNILQCYDAMELWGENGENLIYLFLEYAEDGDLHDFIKNNFITESDAKFLFRQIIKGVEHLHSRGIAHRDLKPSNILIGSYCVIKIGDFGLSKKFNNDDEMFSMCGTPRYAAPEIFNGNGYNGCKADMYSSGIILHDLVTTYGKYQMPSNCEALFKKLANKDPLSRPTATEILKDKWFDRNYALMFRR